ncbi:MAG: LysR family transcriptional regulator [Rhizobiales bacterium PAR1]|nr:MAG: LysR family transcriptional regulator [Rhizobiales bacterium PAR1]
MPHVIPNIRHLRVFREVAQCHSISQAAKKVHLSQPAVTQAVGKLEEDLGISLLDRRRDGLFTTPIGAGFLERVERALEHLQIGARQAIRLGGRPEARGFANFDELVTTAQLKALTALSEARNFAIAARHLGLSQPTLHRSARNLESLAGIELFKTTPAGIDFTPAAQKLVQRTRLALGEIRQGLDEIKDVLGRETTQFVLGSLPLARTYIIPTAINAMIAATPRVQIRVIDGPYAELLRGVREGDLDCMIGALRQPAPAEDVVQEPLFSDPLAIVAGRDHPLTRQLHVTLADTLRYPWVAPPKATPAGRYLFETLRIQDLPETPVRVVSSSLVLLRGLLIQGNYLTIISRHQISEEERQGLLVALPVALKDSHRAIGLTYRADWRPTAMQRRFIDFLRDTVRKITPSNVP